jgi:tripartite-type tricarboxylate transporter receptor subunit TctC
MNCLSGSSHALLVLALAGWLGWQGGVGAQTFPDRPISIVSPQPAGSVSDIVSRALANDLSPAFKQPVIVDNRPGAGQSVGATLVARAAPNGYTLLMLALPNVMPPSIQKGLPFSGNTDFAAVANVLSIAALLGAGPSMPASNLKDFIALLKASPGKYTWGSAGIGSPIHLFGELFNQQAGTKTVHVPYKGYVPALTDIMEGRVDFAFMAMSAMQYVPSGKLKPLGISSAQRVPDYPNLPTLDEQGIKGFDGSVIYLVVTTKGTPQPIVERLNGAINAAIVTEGFATRVKSIGGVTVSKPMTPAQTAAVIAGDEQRWLKLIKDANIQLE